MTEDIKKLREETGAGVMDAKRALEEAGGDYHKAIAVVRKKGLLKAQKKADRLTGAGLLDSYIHNDRVGVLLELRCETDFVAHAEPFQALAHNLTLHIVAMNPDSPETLLTQSFIRDESLTIQDLVTQTITKVGENIQIARFCRYEL
ncbi:MAG: translation elongation factor Ts [Candidatus Harrisonbacteria bacterium CG10_big_fil_rev_8_21_14_0_10_42_17]|uniref:Elongation factor Ts n=1 Tax=Candidatus Harrisonbacteria bacterium CG10_big_fil_rev_8_21_14_0_10_42_17 TaxID=1974584 RepID=A0A2M6WJ05_9BACT|nr:MAG: translation elongation factor Ts [Candidatus Harrisonbacteria bacterium CG10_big_fil_rev_8_21_14_0_10_42_17]